ncbi:hypothetical protein MD484_g770, partial [Candolleomyces efflorescens]
MLALRAFGFALIAPLLSIALAGPTKRAATATCTEIQVRKEWRALTADERTGYIQGVLCLQKIPAHETNGIATTRFEEFQATHIKLTDRVHFVGHFLAWHRQLGNYYGKALREECGYKGPLPYWDWSIDADSSKPLAQSPLFDPVTGFGGDGVPGTYTLPPDPNNESAVPSPFSYKGCVQTGPFKDYVSHLGPGKLRTTHCLVRGIEEMWRPALRSSNVRNTLNTSNYRAFDAAVNSLMNGIHGSGHFIVGGEMTNVYSAAIDPLFYLHHANLDRIWWVWQQADRQKRLTDIWGPTTQNGTTQVTLDFDMDFPALGPNVKVREVMDSFEAPGCFMYQ